jgi:glycosyltransferase involved in cell wall biosynthesis
MTPDLISVIMPNHNGGEYIGRAIDSIIAQTYTHWELIITDDASSDNSMALIKEKAEGDARIQYFSNDENLGAAATRNFCIEQASGRYLAFLDSDDVYYPEKLERQIELLKEKDAVACVSWYNLISESDKYLGTFKPDVKVLYYKDLLRHNYIGLLTILLDRKFLGEISFPDIKVAEDYALWLQILRPPCKGGIYYIQEPLAEYRICSNSLSSNKLRTALAIWCVFRHIEKIPLLKSFYFFVRYIIFHVLNKRNISGYRMRG